MGSKSLGNLAEQIVPVFLAHQNKAAHTFAESIYTLVAPKGYGLRLFSFVVPKVPLGFVVCRRHPYIMKKAEMAVSVFLHSPVKVVAILEVFTWRDVFVLFLRLYQDCVISAFQRGNLF